MWYVVESDVIMFAFSGDLEHLRTISKAQHDNFALVNRMSSHIVSAKTGTSVSCLMLNNAETCL